MAIKQIAIFVENRHGTLAETVSLLADADIDIRAFSVSETQDFGIIRMIVSDTDKAKDVISKSNHVCAITEVVGVKIPDTPGSMAKVVCLFAENEINIEYIYAFIGHSGKSAWVVIRVADNDKAEQLLTQNGFELFTDNDVKSL